MADYVVTCCSTSDLPAEYFEKRNVPCVYFHFNMDGKEYPDDLGKSMPFDEFYKRISNGATPTTAQVNADQFIQAFTPILESGKDILHISFSSGLSGTYNSACLARDELLEKFPGRKLLVVDSLAASSGYGLLVDAACDRRDAGASMDELHNWLMENRLTVHHWFYSNDLTSYFRGGRISRTSAIFGTILNICPLLNVNHLGQLIPRAKCRGKKRATEEMLAKMKKHAKDGLNYSGKCFISNSACYEDARILADKIEAEFKNLNGPVMINSIGTVIGSHTGPGTVALFFFGDERVD